MDIKKLVAEERGKLSTEIQARQRAKEIQEREAYENHPGTIIQRQVTPFIPHILEVVKDFADTVKAKCSVYRPPGPKPDVLVYCRLSITRGLIFKTETDHVLTVYIGVKEHIESGEYCSTTLHNNSIIITNHNTIVASEEIPTDEWMLRELAKYYARFVEYGGYA